MPAYRLHLFCCTNRREPGHKRGCCAEKGSEQIREYLKRRAKELGIPKTRVNAAGCLDQCERGPAIVVYPEGVWYTCPSVEEAEIILQEHLLGGKPVEQLLMR